MADIVRIDAASNAADLGLRALADLAAAAAGKNYRIIGGHMVHILSHVYPTAAAVARVTADADAGMDAVIAGGADLHAPTRNRPRGCSRSSWIASRAPPRHEQHGRQS